ncbi:hypothetical protein BaRGS_00024562 [Batillaria attramentaria]|uniref:Ig-like domain-containing protein n=1 Tax=Batillaria attramentaria TaxID=370345 RepID=A0ABD0KAU8_9CAEN
MFAIFHRLYWGILLLPSLYAETNCHFNITVNGTTSPVANVTENTIAHIPFRIVPEGCDGDSVSLECTWDPGYPQVYNAVIQLPNGTALNKQNNTQQNTSYTLENVTCEDAGNFSCNVPEADDNKTVTLLVKCTTDDDHPKLNRDVVIAGLNIAGFILFVAIVVTVNIICARKGRSPTRRPRQPIETDENDAEGELIELRRLSRSSGGHMYDEVRGSSGGVVVPRPDRRQSPRIGSDGYMVPTPLTTSTRHTDATDQDSPPAASGGYMDMGQGSGAGGYVDMSQGQRSNQDQRPVDVATTAAQERTVKPVYENTT